MNISRLIAVTLASVSMLYADDKPNILFILCDDLGYGDVGVFHQNERAAKKDRNIPFFTTPHIDEVATGGITLTQHYCAAPVCAPSRASLLTGLTQGHAGVRDNQFDKALPDCLTLGSVLQQAGYATAAIGKWGLQGKPMIAEEKGTPTPAGVDFPNWPVMPNDRGFDYFLGYVRHADGHAHYPVEDHKQIWENGKEISSNLDLCYTTDLFTAVAKKWILQQKTKAPEQPFFLYLAFDTPHAKLQNPPCPYPNGGGLDGGVQWTGKPHAMLNTATGSYDGWTHPDIVNATWDDDKNPDTAEVPWPDVQKRHANDVRRMDDCIGDLMLLLKDLQIDQNTIVVFTSDNGPSEESYLKEAYTPTFFEGYGNFEGIKRDTLEGGMREPTIVRWPAKINAGTTSDTESGHWDWLATFANAADIAIPAATDGVTLLPTLTGLGRQRPSTIYSEYFVNAKTPKYQEFDPSHRNKIRGQMQVIHVDGYKGLRTGIQSADDDFEIYDIHKDSKELHNLAKEKDFADIQKKMKAAALRCRMPLNDAPRPYDNTLIPALLNAPNGPGVALCSLKSGSWSWMPDMSLDGAYTASPIGFTLPKDSRTKPPYAIKIEAAIVLPVDGIYTFTITSDSHTMLFVHQIRLIDENKEPSNKPRIGSLALKAGWHPVKILYRTGDTEPTLDFKLTGPDGKEVPLNRNTIKGILPSR